MFIFDKKHAHLSRAKSGGLFTTYGGTVFIMLTRAKSAGNTMLSWGTSSERIVRTKLNTSERCESARLFSAVPAPDWSCFSNYRNNNNISSVNRPHFHKF